MLITVKKWGNSASIRVPRSIMEAASLTLDQDVDVREEAGRIVIEPIREPVFDIEALVSGISADNLHDPVETGEPMGQEIW